MKLPNNTIHLIILCLLILPTCIAKAQADSQELLDDIADELCGSFHEAMANDATAGKEDFLLFTLITVEELSAPSKQSFKATFSVDLDDTPIFNRPFWNLMVNLVESCPTAKSYFIADGTAGVLNEKTQALPGFDSLMAITAQLLAEDIVSQQSPLHFNELVYSKIENEQLPYSDYKLLLERKKGDPFLSAVLAKYNPAVLRYSIGEQGEMFACADKVKMDAALPAADELEFFCEQMQKLDTINEDDDYLMPATALAEAYVEAQQLSFDFASNRPVYVKQYANKIWFKHKEACPHFAGLLNKYYKSQF